MGIKELVVTVDPSRTGKERLAFALRLAEGLRAHVTAYYTGPTVGIVAEGAVTDIVDAIRRDTVGWASDHGISADWVLSGEPLIEDMLTYVRCADLAVFGLGAPERGAPDPQGFRIDEVVTQAGRPILGIPVGVLPETFPGTVLVAWDGSRESARALHDAIPLMRLAGSVTVLSLGEDGAELAGRAVAHLGRHGIPAVADRDTVAHDDVGEEILQRAAILEVDLIVAGAYGHPRLMERLVGGASNSLGRQMLAPVLVSH